MTKQELIKIMGSEDGAEYAMIQVLKMIKPDFVITCLEINRDQTEAKYNERKANGYYTEFSEFPAYFNLFSEASDSPLVKQYWENRYREIEEDGDKSAAIAARNMYAHAMNGIYNLKEED